MKGGGGERVGYFRNLKRGRATPIPWGVLLGGLLFVNLFILLPAFVADWLSTETGWPTAYGSDCTRRGCVLVNLYHSPKLLDGGSAHELGLFALLWSWPVLLLGVVIYIAQFWIRMAMERRRYRNHVLAARAARKRRRNRIRPMD